jgi:hypothetical protein
MHEYGAECPAEVSEAMHNWDPSTDASILCFPKIDQETLSKGCKNLSLGYRTHPYVHFLDNIFKSESSSLSGFYGASYAGYKAFLTNQKPFHALDMLLKDAECEPHCYGGGSFTRAIEAFGLRFWPLLSIKSLRGCDVNLTLSPLWQDCSYLVQWTLIPYVGEEDMLGWESVKYLPWEDKRQIIHRQFKGPGKLGEGTRSKSERQSLRRRAMNICSVCHDMFFHVYIPKHYDPDAPKVSVRSCFISLEDEEEYYAPGPNALLVNAMYKQITVINATHRLYPDDMLPLAVSDSNRAMLAALYSWSDIPFISPQAILNNPKLESSLRGIIRIQRAYNGKVCDILTLLQSNGEISEDVHILPGLLHNTECSIPIDALGQKHNKRLRGMIAHMRGYPFSNWFSTVPNIGYDVSTFPLVMVALHEYTVRMSSIMAYEDIRLSSFRSSECIAAPPSLLECIPLTRKHNLRYLKRLCYRMGSTKGDALWSIYMYLVRVLEENYIPDELIFFILQISGILFTPVRAGWVKQEWKPAIQAKIEIKANQHGSDCQCRRCARLRKAYSKKRKALEVFMEDKHDKCASSRRRFH